MLLLILESQRRKDAKRNDKFANTSLYFIDNGKLLPIDQEAISYLFLTLEIGDLPDTFRKWVPLKRDLLITLNKAIGVKNTEGLLNPDEHTNFFMLFDSDGYDSFSMDKMKTTIQYAQKLNMKMTGYAFSKVVNDSADLFAYTSERYALASTLFYRELDQYKELKEKVEDPVMLEGMVHESFLDFMKRFLVTGKPENKREIPFMKLNFAIDDHLNLKGDTLEKLGIINKAYNSPEDLIMKMREDTGVLLQKTKEGRWIAG